MNLGASPVVRFLLIILIVVLVLYGFNRYVYAPNQEKIYERKQELSRLTSALFHVKETVENLPKVEAELESLQEEWERLEILVPKSEKVTNFITHVSKAEHKAGIYIISIEPQAIEPKELYTVHPYRLQLEGSYHSFARFLGALSSLPQLITLSEFTLSANPNSVNGDDAVSIKCLLSSYTSLKRSS